MSGGLWLPILTFHLICSWLCLLHWPGHFIFATGYNALATSQAHERLPTCASLLKERQGGLACRKPKVFLLKNSIRRKQGADLIPCGPAGRTLSSG